MQMTEKQKDSSSSTKSMEKTSLIDLDIGKDFLTSWKSMSVTEDDPMDFDFSKVTEGNKQAFKFDNLDMDFNLDNDFGKISSFKVDIPELDVSSPVKKSAKPNEKSKVSTEGKAQGKSNQSTFQFDFNEFDDLSFSPSLMKKAKQTNANQDAELLLSPNRSLGLKETFGASEGETTSKFDSQLCAEPESWSKEKLQTPLVEVHIPSKSEISKDQATNAGATTSPQKPISDRTQQTFQDNCPKEIITSVEPYAKDKCWNSSVRFVSENSSTQHTASNSQEEVDCLTGKERTNTGREQSLFDDKTDLGVDCGCLQRDELPVDMAGSQSNDGETSQFSGDNPVRVDSKCNSEPGQGDSQFEQTSASASKQVLRETEAVWETSELVTQSNSEITGGGRVILDPKHVNEVVRSKYFKGSDGAKSQMQQSSLSQTKIATFDTERVEAVHLSCADIGAIKDAKALPDEESLPNIRSESFKGLDDTKSHPQQESISQVKVGAIGSQRITTWQPCTADERKLDNKNALSGNKFVALPKARSLPREQSKGDSNYVGSQGSPSNQTSNRGGFDSYDARRTLANTSRLHDMGVAKGELVLNGTENKVKDLYTFRCNNKKWKKSRWKARKLHSKDAHSGSKPIVFPKAIPREQIEADSVRTRNEGSIKELTSNSSHVETSSSNEQTYRPASLLRLNPKLQVSGMKSTQNKINSLDNEEVSHLKDGIRVSVISNLNQMRTTETIHPSSKSTLQKDTTLLNNSGQCADLKEDTGPRMAYHADTREEGPLSTTLKRKEIEESSANLVLLKPTKRLFVSPSGRRNFKVLSEKLVDKQDLPCINTEKVLNNSQSPCLNSPHKLDMKKLETPFEMDNDTTVKRADACAKELDNLVNMLKKKHEEAKEILVRAFVTNNKLLMLNHPIYDEKIRMMEKFDALWLSK